jgi:hypothetical protein
MSTVPTPTTALTLDEINPASFDFWLRDDWRARWPSPT